MNQQRRKKLKIIMEKMGALREELQLIFDEEQDAFDNMPESLQQSERGEKVEACLCDLNDSIAELESIEDKISEVVQ